MPETIPHPTCWACPAPATRIVEWRVDDPHSTCGEHFGPYHLLCCDDCVGDSHAQAHDEGADHTCDYLASPADLAAVCDIPVGA